MYLILDECPDYPKTRPEEGARQGARHVAIHPNRGLSYERTRAALEKLYPGATIYSPLERAPGGALVVFVYLSPRRDGVGRQICNFELWAVMKKESGK